MYRLTVSIDYCPASARRILELMVGCDLGISQMFVTREFLFTFNAEQKEKDIEKLKKALKQFFEKEGYLVYNLKIKEQVKIIQ